MDNNEFCNKCGAEIPKESIFCNKCGEKIVVKEKKIESVYDEEIAPNNNADDKKTKIVGYFVWGFIIVVILSAMLTSNPPSTNVTTQTEIKSENIEEKKVPEPIKQVENILPNISEITVKLKEVNDIEENADSVEQTIFNQAKERWAYGKYDEAIIVFNDFIENNKESVLYDEALSYLANSYIKQQEYNKGIEWYKKLLSECPDSSRYTSACYNLANTYYYNSDYKNEAMLYYIKVLENATLDDKSYVEDSIKKIKDFYGDSINVIYSCSESNCKNQANDLYKYCTKHTCTKVNCENKKEQNSKLCAEHIEKKSKGVSIGMTKQEVLDSSWGEPDDINKTITQYGTHEQWVYRYKYVANSYLYFEDGILTTIQN